MANAILCILQRKNLQWSCASMSRAACGCSLDPGLTWVHQNSPRGASVVSFSQPLFTGATVQRSLVQWTVQRGAHGDRLSASEPYSTV